MEAWGLELDIVAGFSWVWRKSGLDFGSALVPCFVYLLVFYLGCLGCLFGFSREASRARSGRSEDGMRI